LGGAEALSAAGTGASAAAHGLGSTIGAGLPGDAPPNEGKRGANHQGEGYAGFGSRTMNAADRA